MPRSYPGDPPNLGAAWEEQAGNWARWARTPGHDSFWQFHRDAFLRLLPPPGRLTLDIGCGEGRLARDLKGRGHRIRAFDISPTLVRLAAEADPSLDVAVADAAHLPIENEAADLAVAFLSLHDMDDMPRAIREVARALSPGGRFCYAIVHPMSSAGEFAARTADAAFVIAGSYLGAHRYVDDLQRAGLSMSFQSMHRPLQDYFHAMEEAGLLVETLREVGETDEAVAADPAEQRWQRVPLFLHIRGVKR